MVVDAASSCAKAPTARAARTAQPTTIEITMGIATVRVPAGIDPARLASGAARRAGCEHELRYRPGCVCWWRPSQWTSAEAPTVSPRWYANKACSTIHSRETIFIFRSKRSDRLKILAWDGSGLALFWKRLEHGALRWPPISDGVMRLSASQLAALVDGMDWSRLHVHDVARPSATA